MSFATALFATSARSTGNAHSSRSHDAASSSSSSSSSLTGTVVTMAAATTVSIVTILMIKWKLEALDKKKSVQGDDELSTSSSAIIPGFPSPPDAHWLFGHLIQLEGGPGGRFVDGYPKVYVNHADPQTGRGSFWFFTAPTISLLQGKDVKAVLNASSFRKSISLVDVHTKNFLGHRALVALMGKEWRLYRSAVHKSFTPAAIKQSQNVILEVGETLADSLLLLQTKIGNQPTKVLPLMKMATMDVFGKAALSVDFECCQKLQLSPVAAAFEHLTAEFTRRLKTPWDPFSYWYNVPTPANREHKRQKELIRGFIAQQIAKARAAIQEEEDNEKSNAGKQQPKTSSNSNTSDLLTNLIKATAAGADSYTNVSDDAMGDVMLTLLFGGYDTTSITLTYALYLLAKHPEMEKTCLEEINTVLGDAASGDSSLLMDLEDGPEQLPYTRAIILETLRLFPPAPITSRTMENPITLQNPTVTIEKGQPVMIPIWCIQRYEKNYPRPDEVHPERWVRRRKNEESDGTGAGTSSTWEERPSDDLQSNTLVPPANRDAFCVFAAGARNCVGRVLAMQESVTLLALLLRKLKFECVENDYEVMPTSCAVVQQPQDGMPMIIKPR